MARPRSTLRAWVQRYVIALGVVGALTVGGVVGANVAIESKLAGIDRIHLRTDNLPGQAEAGNYLVIGSDTRSFVESKADAAHFGTASQAGVGGQRGDAIMIMHIEPDQHKTMIVSVPRDMVVDVPGLGPTRINAALGAGPQRVIDTLKQNFGIKIQHYVQVNFASFREIVNAIGSVHIYFPYAARDKESGLNVPNPGCVALNGESALAYARSRFLEYDINGRWKNVSPRADLDRIDRQQAFIRRLASVAYTRSLKNPLVASEVADAVLPKLQTDDTFGRDQVFGLVKAFRGVDPNDPRSIQTSTFPNKPYGDNARLLPEKPQASLVAAQLNDFGGATQLPKVKPAQVRVKVLNGSGTSGLAAATLDALKRQFGFVAGATGNWPSSMTTTQIRHGPAGLAAARLVQDELGGEGELVDDPSITANDVTVVLGSSFVADGVKAAASSTAAPTSSTTAKSKATSTTAPVDPAAACKP